MSTPGTPEPQSFTARVRAAWRKLFGSPTITNDRERAMDAQRNRAQLEIDRLNAHRDMGRFTGSNGGF